MNYLLVLLVKLVLAPHNVYALDNCSTFFVKPSIFITRASQYNEEAYQVLKKNTEDLAHYYLQAKQDGDPHILTLESLGFRFTENEILTPRPEQIVFKLEALIDQIKIRENLSENDVYRPARSFSNNTGELIWLGSRDKVPVGFYPSRKSVVLTTEDYSTLKARGLMPLSEINRGMNETISNLEPFMHDLAHFGVFLRNPKIIKIDQAISHANKTNMLGEDLTEFITETLVWANDKKTPEIHNFLRQINIDPQQKFLRFETVYNKLKAMSDDQVDLIISTILRHQYFWYERMGGASADIVYKRSSKERKFSLTTDLMGLEWIFSVYGRHKSNDERLVAYVKNTLEVDRYRLGKRDSVIKEVAFHITQLQIISNYSIIDFYSDLAALPEPRPLLRHLMQESEANFYPKHRSQHLFHSQP